MKGIFSIVLLCMVNLVAAQEKRDIVYPLPVSSSDTGYAHLREAFGDKIGPAVSFVGLGEVSHGGLEPIQFKVQLLEYLVAEKNFRTILVEFADVDLKHLNTYLQDNTKTDVSKVDSLIGKAFYSSSMTIKTTTALVVWLKQFNLSHPNDRVTLKGIDIIGMWPSFFNYLFYNYILPYDAASALQLQYKWSTGATDDMMWNDLQEWYQQHQSLLKQSLTSFAFEELKAEMKDAGECVLYNNKTKDNMLQAAFFRDSLMAENVVQRAVGKTIIWSHNLHLDKEPTARTLGNMLYSKKGDACFTVLTDFSGRANVRIYNDKPTAARWLQKQYEARKETAASMLKKQLKVDKGIVFYNDLVRLQLPVKLSSIDAYGGYEVVGYGQAFDALVIFDNITPTVLYDSSN